MGWLVSNAVRIAKQHHKGGYPVVDPEGNLVGICTRSDFYKGIRQIQGSTVMLKDIMTHPVITAKTTDTLADVLLTFVRHPIKRVVVVEAKDLQKPVGILTPFDILNETSN